MGRIVPSTHTRLAHYQRSGRAGNFLSRRFLTSHRPTPTALDAPCALVVSPDYRANVYDALYHDSHPAPVGKPRKNSATPSFKFRCISQKNGGRTLLSNRLFLLAAILAGGMNLLNGLHFLFPRRAGFRRKSL